MLIGICGAHRTGKTTLAEEYAKYASIDFYRTNASEVFKTLGLQPNKEYSFDVVLNVQETILASFTERWKEAYENDDITDAITDRTPIDLIAYTLAHVKQDNITEENNERLMNYILDCYEILNRYFGLLVVLTPEIDIVEEDGKANTSWAYINLINKLILGSIVDDNVLVFNYKMPSYCKTIEERIEKIDLMVDTSIESCNRRFENMVLH